MLHLDCENTYPLRISSNATRCWSTILHEGEPMIREPTTQQHACDDRASEEQSKSSTTDCEPLSIFLNCVIICREEKSVSNKTYHQP